MTYRNKILRQYAAKARAMELSQRPDAQLDSRTRRAVEAELSASQRLAPGLGVDARGRQELRHDRTIRTDTKSRFQVNADALRFATPVDGSQAATKDYVDSQITDSGSGTAWRKQYSIFSQSNTLTSSYQAIRTVSYQNELDLDGLMATGTDGILAKTGHYYLGTFTCVLQNNTAAPITSSFSLYTPADATYTLPVQWGIDLTIAQRRVTSGAGGEGHTTVRLHQLIDFTAYTGVAQREVYAIGIGNGLFVSYPRLSLQRLDPYDQSTTPPGLPGIGPNVEFVADQTSVATRTNIQFTDLSVGEIDTWAWTFGDGTTSTQQNPIKAYASAGTYTVTLEAGGGGVTNTETKISYITVT